MKNFTKRLLALTLAVFSLALLCSCGSGAKMAADEGDFYYDEVSEAEDWGYKTSSGGEKLPDATADDAESPDVSQSGDIANRKLIKNVYMNAQTKTYDEFTASLKAAISANGGYIENSELYDDGYHYSTRRGDYVIRIPAKNLDAFVEGIKGKATVTHYNEKLDDVTIEYVDLESRIGSLRAERDKLNELLLSAENLDQVILLQDKIEYLTYQIESFESKIRTLSELVSYSTVHISVREVEREEIVEKQGTWEEIGSNLSANFADVGEGFRRFFISFISGIPYILVFLLIAAINLVIVIIIVKAVKKKHRKQ